VAVSHIDKANPAAMAWFAELFGRRLAEFGPMAAYFAVEEKLSTWTRGSWPPAVAYWRSPTYSAAALTSFQSFLHERGLRVRLFPVDRIEFVKPGLTELVASAPGDSLWSWWFDWRFNVQTDYLRMIRETVRQVSQAPLVFMSWQRLIDEAEPISHDDWRAERWNVGYGPGQAENAIFGISAKQIAKSGAIDGFVIEYGEDQLEEFNAVNTGLVRQALTNSPVQFGTFVQLYNYEGRTHVSPEAMDLQLDLGFRNQAQILVVYDVATLVPGNGRYAPALAERWRERVASLVQKR
jgi:hypothetical protein